VKFSLTLFSFYGKLRIFIFKSHNGGFMSIPPSFSVRIPQRNFKAQASKPTQPAFRAAKTTKSSPAEEESGKSRHVLKSITVAPFSSGIRGLRKMVDKITNNTNFIDEIKKQKKESQESSN
jgi:hypothetical protein